MHLAARLDAEDWREASRSNAYLDEASAAVTDFGRPCKAEKLGDGLMALFGYPQAQENDAEPLHVKAALAIQRALSDLNARNAAKGVPELSARIGVEGPGRSSWKPAAWCSAMRPISPRGCRRRPSLAQSSSP